ncbi:MAG: hypothetical protein ABI863_13505 [Ginsengibacter sp.]
MKLKINFIALTCTILGMSSCKKESDAKFCRQLVDNLGNDINSVYCGDTARTFFQGREIVIRETTDSLKTLQFR